MSKTWLKYFVLAVQTLPLLILRTDPKADETCDVCTPVELLSGDYTRLFIYAQRFGCVYTKETRCVLFGETNSGYGQSRTFAVANPASFGNVVTCRCIDGTVDSTPRNTWPKFTTHMLDVNPVCSHHMTFVGLGAEVICFVAVRGSKWCNSNQNSC